MLNVNHNWSSDRLQCRDDCLSLLRCFVGAPEWLATATPHPDLHKWARSPISTENSREMAKRISSPAAPRLERRAATKTKVSITTLHSNDITGDVIIWIEITAVATKLWLIH